MDVNETSDFNTGDGCPFPVSPQQSVLWVFLSITTNHDDDDPLTFTTMICP